MSNSKLREQRVVKGLSQIQLSYLSKVPSTSISDFELGKRKPWPRARKALAKALKVSEAELFGEEDGSEH